MPSTSQAERVVIVGAGGHGSELHSYFVDLSVRGSGAALAGFIDDSRSVGPFLTTEVLGGLTKLEALVREGKAPSHYITAFGSNAVRLRFVRAIDGFGQGAPKAWALVHPSAQVGYDVTLGAGTLLAPNVLITTRVKIGVHCILNVKASLSHDCVIGDFVNINPAATLCGNVNVGDGSFIGAGAVVKEKVSIGRGVTVGAGATVLSDLPDGVTAVGTPARIIKQSSEGWPKS